MTATPDVFATVDAALVVGELAQNPMLPEICTWRICEGGVSGQLGRAGADDLTIADLHEWAVFLGSADEPLHIHTKPYTARPERTRVWVEARRDGVRVEIWSAVRTIDPAGSEAS